MNLDLTILLVLALLALVGWNIYLSLGRRENKQEESRLYERELV